MLAGALEQQDVEKLKSGSAWEDLSGKWSGTGTGAGTGRTAVYLPGIQRRALGPVVEGGGQPVVQAERPGPFFFSGEVVVATTRR